MIQWGVLGTGKIARKMIASLSHSQLGRLEAIASTNIHTRQEFNNIKAYTHYEALLKDPDIDVIYIATPHQYHAFWSIAALQHKKAVLCEKPAVLKLSQMQDICQVAQQNQTFFMEAMKSKFTPAFQNLVADLRCGVIGEIQKIEANFCSDSLYHIEQGHYLLDREQGGAWFDVGVYPIAFALACMGKTPNRMTAVSQCQAGIDLYTRAELIFDDEVTAILEVAIDRIKERTAIIFGELGKIQVNLFNRTEQYEIIKDGQSTLYHSNFEVDDFFDQLEEVNRCLIEGRTESKIHSLQDSLNEIKVLETIRKQILP